VKRTLTGLAWVSPWLLGFVAFMALPIAMSVYYSFTDYTLLEDPVWIGAANYRRLMADPVFWIVLKNTVVFAAVTIPAITVLALGVAGLMNMKVRGVGVFRTAVYIPFLVPTVASAMIWLWLYNSELGLVNQALRELGLPGPNWLGDRAWAMPAIILMNLWIILGPPVTIYIAAMQDVPRAVLEAAALDGMGPIRRFTHVTLPMISPLILFNVITTAINSWQVFAVPYIMTEGGPDRATYFYTMYLYDSAFTFQQMGYASAMAWVLFLLILGMTGLLFLAARRVVFERGGG